MRAGDGVAIKECEKLLERVKERPVREEADTLVGVDGALGGGGAAAAAGDGCCCPRVTGGRGSAGVRVRKAQLGALLIAQALQREGLIKLDGSTIDLDQYGSNLSGYQLTSSYLLLNTSLHSFVSGNKGQQFNIKTIRSQNKLSESYISK